MHEKCMILKKVHDMKNSRYTLHEKCTHLVLLRSAFPRIRTEYGEILMRAGKCGPE